MSQKSGQMRDENGPVRTKNRVATREKGQKRLEIRPEKVQTKAAKDLRRSVKKIRRKTKGLI